MCDFNKGFILCKCSNTNALTTKHEGKEYIWTLSKYIGLNEDRIMGKYRLPVSDIGKGLTAAYLHAQLNNRPCFDFDYQPSEGDNLLIQQVDDGERIEFIYRNGIWSEGHYSPFKHKSREVNKGVLKSIT